MLSGVNRSAIDPCDHGSRRHWLAGLGHFKTIARISLDGHTRNEKGLSFYICAHQVDWIYFRGEWAYWDLRFQRAIVIFVTAGDAQCGDGWWQLRENAAASALARAVGQPMMRAVTKRIHGHRIVRRQCGQSAMWCLRLPNRSDIRDPPPLPGIEELYTGTASRVASVDRTAVYTSWADLCRTLEQIVLQEARKARVSNPFINAPLYKSDSGTNPGDHHEHTLTGLAIQSFAQPFPRAWWYGYCISDHHGDSG